MRLIIISENKTAANVLVSNMLSSFTRGTLTPSDFLIITDMGNLRNSPIAGKFVISFPAGRYEHIFDMEAYARARGAFVMRINDDPMRVPPSQ